MRWLGLLAAVFTLSTGGSALAARKPPTARQHVEATVLRHGTVEMQLTTSPEPWLIGPGTNLSVVDGRLEGTFEDGHFDVAVSSTRAEGVGPRGKIALDLTSGDHSLHMKGLWNGQKVDLTFTDRGVTGKLVHHVSGSGRAVESCRLGMDRNKGALVMGPMTCLGSDVPLYYTIKPAPRLHLHRPDVALLLLTYFAAAPSAPPVS
jgi:hypothetical protein